MKRKRHPHGIKPKAELKPTGLDPHNESDEWNGISGNEEEEDSFQGFSSDEETIEESTFQPASVRAPIEGSTSHAKKRGRKAEPTQEELMELMFRSSSFQSNLFKLQVDELLSEVRVKYDRMEKVETILHQLKGILMKLPASEEKLVFQPFGLGS
jgi:U3 small nucleolar RNA-associated protein 22